MLFWLSLMALMAVSVRPATTRITEGRPSLAKCTCWEGYEPERIDVDTNNKNRNLMQCTGIDVTHSMPCNVLVPPKCVCTGRYNGILKDRMGTWCTVYAKGNELKRWRCENHDEWQLFFDQLHERRKLVEVLARNKQQKQQRKRNNARNIG